MISTVVVELWWHSDVWLCIDFDDDDADGSPGLLHLKTEKNWSDSEEGIRWLKNVLEQLGSPHFRQFHDMLLLYWLLGLNLWLAYQVSDD